MYTRPVGNFVSEVVSPFINGGRQNARGIDLGIQVPTKDALWNIYFSNPGDLSGFVHLPVHGSTAAREVAGRANDDWWEGSLFGIAVRRRLGTNGRESRHLTGRGTTST